MKTIGYCKISVLTMLVALVVGTFGGFALASGVDALPGDLLVVSKGRNGMGLFDGTTGAVKDEWFALGTNMKRPDWMVMDANSFFVTGDDWGSSAGSITRHDITTGDFLASLHDSPTFVPRGLAIDSAGDVYVGGYMGSWPTAVTCYISKYDASDGYSKTLLASGSDVSGPGGLRVGPDGYLYVLDTLQEYPASLAGVINRFDTTTGALIDTFITVDAGDAIHPFDIEFGPNGNLFLAGGSTCNVVEFDGVTGDKVGEFELPPEVVDLLPEQHLLGLAFHPVTNNLFVNTGNSKSIHEFDDETRAYIGEFASAGDMGALTTLRAMAFLPQETECGDSYHPYPTGDVNKDCYVDLLDFAAVAKDWNDCTDPACD